MFVEKGKGCTKKPILLEQFWHMPEVGEQQGLKVSILELTRSLNFYVLIIVENSGD
jgi:hypothetical protein